MSRSARPLTCVVSSPAPISQSAWSARCFFAYCLTSEPKTSEIDSFSAPDWFE